jgi:hypothetical protein
MSPVRSGRKGQNVSVMFLATLLAFALAAAADDPPSPQSDAPPPPKIYQCPDADGNIVFQDDPCAVVKPAPKVKPTEKPPQKPASQPAKKPAAKPAKAAAKPAPVAGPSQAPAKPKTEPVVVKTSAPARPSLKLPPGPAGKLDPRWATPEATLRTFIGAIDAGDRELAVSCLTSYALGDLGPDPAALPLDDLKATVGAFTGYVNEGDLGPYWSIRALRQGMRPRWIFFERNGAGEWKIGVI